MCKLRIGNMLRGRSLKRNITYITRFKITGGGRYALSASNRHHSNVCAQSRRHHLPSTRLAIVTSVVGSSRSKDSFSIGRKALIGLVEGARRSEEAPSVR